MSIKLNSVMAAVVVAQAGVAQSGIAQPLHMVTYQNTRYGYAIAYPAKLLSPRPESPNGDGRLFVGADGAKLIVFASWNVLQSGISEAAEETARRLAGAGGKISYRRLFLDRYVISGSTRDGTVFYAKSILARGRFVSFELMVPATRATAWKTATAYISNSLRA